MKTTNKQWQALSAARYLSLETYRRDGTAVRTPLWFAVRGDGVALVAYSRADAGKVKRLRRDPRCRVAICTMRGAVTGPWLAGRAELLGEAAADMRLLGRKYWPWKQLLDFFALFRRGPGRTTMVIRPG